MTPLRGDAELTATPLFVDRLSAVFPPGHPFERRRRIDVEQLRRVPLILQRDSSVRKLLDDAFESLGSLALPAYEVTLLQTALAMVNAGLGVAVVSSTSARGARLAGLRAKMVMQAGLIRQIGIVQKTGRSLSPAAEQFIVLLRQICTTSRR
jgi:DNA-binding transcriptional LysR family regulator